jgi:hypothetical protein
MSTFYTDADNDLQLDSNGRLVFESDEVVAAAVKLKNRFQRFRGEWFLDTREGIPYFEFVFVKNPNLDVIRRIFTEVILSTPPIETLDKLELFYLPGERLLAFEFEARAADGRVIQGGSGQPFIVNGQPEGSDQEASV